MDAELTDHWELSYPRSLGSLVELDPSAASKILVWRHEFEGMVAKSKSSLSLGRACADYGWIIGFFDDKFADSK